ncbi:MAG: peptidoglycan DD-metalloendopeptidase family protein [Dysgonamonadaceae bacterium]|jgi:murein DD-endopeptidase MepM/ murein hydrolase activator NlpD|nr:peptidoglycan DD-metalloendopeptidase family protein [Dysgonamonadaceae bacterium]
MKQKKQTVIHCCRIIGASVFLSFLSANGAMANQPKEDPTEKKTNTPATVVGKHVEEDLKIEKPKPLLTADIAPSQRELKIIDSLSFEQELEVEELLFPADEIYQGWNNATVNPYSSLSMPDSFVVDLQHVTMPIDAEAIRVTSPFGFRGRRPHKGIDLKVQVGDTIRAAWDGKIRVKRFEKRGYGNFLILRHSNGLETVYGHLSKFLVDIDQVVQAGDPIALGGNTGRSTGPHLHFETRFLGAPINPAEIFDFNNKVTHDDAYVFYKAKILNNKYTGAGKIAYHRVKSGETLSAIARKYGMTVGQLCRLNKISPTVILREGKALRCS